MPKRRSPARIPTPSWERPRSRLRRELGGKVYLVGGIVGLVVVAVLVIVFAFVQDYLEERARPGSAAISVDERTYSLDYFARRLRLQIGGSADSNFLLAANTVAAQIIEEETVLRFAGELGVSATAEEVDAELATRLGIEKDSPAFASAYQAELDRTGFKDVDYRQVTEAQLLARKVRDKLSADIPAEAEQVHFRLIQVTTEEQAQDVLTRLQAGEDFAALAKEVSTDPQTKDQGGDRGWLAKGTADSLLEDTLFALEPGAISDPFPTPNAVFLFQVLEKAVRPLEEGQRQQVQQQSYQRWLKEKQETMEIKNFVATDSEQLDQEKLQWAVQRAQSS